MDKPKPGTPGFEYPRGDKLRRILAPFRPADARTVLDMGCGDGLKASRYHLGLEITGFEADRDKAAEARKHLRECYALDMIHIADVLTEWFDWVTFIDSIEHVAPERARKILGHAKRVARYAVTVFAPAGDTSEWRHKENELDRHASIWDEVQFAQLGFEVTRLQDYHGPGYDALIAHWRKAE